MKTFLALTFSIALAACGGGGDGDDGGGDDAPPPADPTANFVGSYQANLTISGQGSVTAADPLSINEGSTSDLIVNSRWLGNIKSTILGASSFSVDQQQILLTDPETGQAFNVTIMGQGTVTDGILNANGTISNTNGALQFTLAGSRL